MSSKVSIIIPSRNERFLVPTVQDVLSKARGDIEVLVILDGYWPEPGLPTTDKRLHFIHRGTARGMRPGINAAVALAKGDFFLKLDAHCMMDEGFDVKLVADCEKDWVVVPRRHRLDAERWTLQEVKKPPIDYHYLSFPFAEGVDGLHGSPWTARALSRERILIDDEMSSQGSCWFMHRKAWNRIGPLDSVLYGFFGQEFQEIGLKAWLGGGAVKVNKKTWYAHLHKGPKYGRGYSMSGLRFAEGMAASTRFWMLDQWEERRHDLRWLVEKFAPVPTWPEDLDEAFATSRRKLYGNS